MQLRHYGVCSDMGQRVETTGGVCVDMIPKRDEGRILGGHFPVSNSVIALESSNTY